MITVRSLQNDLQIVLGHIYDAQSDALKLEHDHKNPHSQTCERCKANTREAEAREERRRILGEIEALEAWEAIYKYGDDF